jgi:AraC-like DNA-binding protein
MGRAYFCSGKFGYVVLCKLKQDLIQHAHSNQHLIYVLGAGASAATLQIKGVSPKLGSDFLYGINDYESHAIKLGKEKTPIEILFIYLKKSWIDQYTDINDPAFKFIESNIKLTKILKSNLHELITIVKKRNVATSQIEDAVLNIFNELNINPLDAGNTRRKKLIDYRLRLSMQYMQQNLLRKYNIKDVATSVGISRSRLFKLFENELNATPKIIRDSQKMDAAIQALRVSGKPIATIAKDLGFTSAANFSRFFKSMFGQTPSSIQVKK